MTDLRGIFAMVGAAGVFIGSDTCVKLALSRGVPMFEIVTLRGITSVTLCLVVLLALGHGGYLLRMFNPFVAGRALCEVVCNFTFTLAIALLPLGDMVAILQICPLLILLGARIIWGESLGLSRALLIVLGLTGALLIAQPGATAASPYAVLGFISAAFAATRDLLTRRVPPDTPALVVSFTVLAALLVAGVIGMTGLETPIVPDAKVMGLMLLSGLLLVCGHTGIFLAYKIGPARSVAPFMYTLTPWAVLSSILVFGEYPNRLALLGIACILTAGLAIIFLDHRRKISQI